MKGPQLATLVWLGNLLVLAGGGFVGYRYYTDIQGQQDSVFQRELKTQVKPIEWQKQTGSAGPNLPLNMALTLRPRPQAQVPVTPVTEKPIEKEPTEEELRKEAEEWLNKEFTLLRSWGNPVVVSHNQSKTAVTVYVGTNFKEEFSKSTNAAAKALGAYNITLLSVHRDNTFDASDPEARPDDHAMFRVPSTRAKYKDRFFEVPLAMHADAFKPVDVNKLSGGSVSASGGASSGLTPRNPPSGDQVERDDTPPRESTRPEKSTFDEKTGIWELGTDDYMNPALPTELAKYAKVVSDKDGNPIGIQADESMPEDNVFLKRGGRRGDIIKSINGEAVRSMADVRRVVRTQYNAGKDVFVVNYERDGIPGTQTIRVPR